jgi:hypothetical protein
MGQTGGEDRALEIGYFVVCLMMTAGCDSANSIAHEKIVTIAAHQVKMGQIIGKHDATKTPDLVVGLLTRSRVTRREAQDQNVAHTQARASPATGGSRPRET